MIRFNVDFGIFYKFQCRRPTLNTMRVRPCTEAWSHGGWVAINIKRRKGGRGSTEQNGLHIFFLSLTFIQTSLKNGTRLLYQDQDVVNIHKWAWQPFVEI